MMNDVFEINFDQLNAVIDPMKQQYNRAMGSVTLTVRYRQIFKTSKKNIDMKQLLLAVAGIISISAGLLGSIYESLNISQDDAKKCLMTSIAEGYVSTPPDHSSLIYDARQLSSEV